MNAKINNYAIIAIVQTLIILCSGCSKGTLYSRQPFADIQSTPLSDQISKSLNSTEERNSLYYQISTKFIPATEISNDSIPDKYKNMSTISLDDLCKHGFSINTTSQNVIIMAENKNNNTSYTHSVDKSTLAPIFQVYIKNGSENSCSASKPTTFLGVANVLNDNINTYTINYEAISSNENDIPFNEIEAMITDTFGVNKIGKLTSQKSIEKLSDFINSRLKSSNKSNGNISCVYKENKKSETRKNYIPIIYSQTSNKEQLIGYVQFEAILFNSLIMKNDNGNPNFKNIRASDISKMNHADADKISKIIYEFRDKRQPISTISILLQNISEFDLNDFDTALCVYLAYENSDTDKQRIENYVADYERFVPKMIEANINIKRYDELKTELKNKIIAKLEEDFRNECIKCKTNQQYDTELITSNAYTNLEKYFTNNHDILKEIVHAMDNDCKKTYKKYTYTKTIITKTPYEMWGDEYLPKYDIDVPYSDLYRRYINLQSTSITNDKQSKNKRLHTFFTENFKIIDTANTVDETTSQFEHISKYKLLNRRCTSKNIIKMANLTNDETINRSSLFNIEPCDSQFFAISKAEFTNNNNETNTQNIQIALCPEISINSDSTKYSSISIFPLYIDENVQKLTEYITTDTCIEILNEPNPKKADPPIN